MPDIIRLLPDSVANQIAAGEVIQRPASVVKELMENAIDAGATNIQVIVKDGGKTLIQVIDNAAGMSETDARMAFERHATSKITDAADLYSIRTMGFRGEALASIAAISEVELRTRQADSEIGSSIIVVDSKVKSQETISCSTGSNFLVKNLFFNIPARRKFLKTEVTELRNIIIEFQRVVLTYPEINFTLIHNDSSIYQLVHENILKRVITVFGKSIQQSLISINAKTSIVEISGFIGRPENAKKTGSEQFFFVNNRFMKHPYFHKAIMSAYEKILLPGYIPSYFIYFDVDPASIDVNIHPTKTEIKFEEERVVWQILQASVKQSLGKFNVLPSLDFDRDGDIEIPPMRKNQPVMPPEIPVNHEYNPFNEDFSGFKGYEKNKLNQDWEVIFTKDRFDSSVKNSEILPEPKQTRIFPDKEEGIDYNRNLLQVKNRFIMVPVKSGLMIVDQKRAHERILFEQYLQSLINNFGVAQQNLFPVTIELDPAEYVIMKEIIEDICRLGFDIRDFGKNAFVINGMPAHSSNTDPKEIIQNLLAEYKSTKGDISLNEKEKVAYSLAKASAIGYGKRLTNEEMHDLIDQLFACDIPGFSPSGKPVVNILSAEEIDKRL